MVASGSSISCFSQIKRSILATPLVDAVFIMASLQLFLWGLR